MWSCLSLDSILVISQQADWLLSQAEYIVSAPYTLVASIAGAVVTETEPRAGSVCSVSTLAVPKCCCCSGSQSRPKVENLLSTI